MSCTATSTPPAAECTDTVTAPPLGVNFNALSSRLTSTWRSFSRSPRTSACASGSRTDSATPAASARSWNASIFAADQRRHVHRDHLQRRLAALQAGQLQ